MKILFNRNNSIGILCLLLLALLPVSCLKDDYAAKEKATVKMTFTTRAISNPTTNAGGLEANEHMRTLRVIVARSSNSEILYNLKYEIDENETSKTITFSEMTVNADGEAFDFYAIANEEKVNTEKSWDNVTVDDLKGMSLNDEFLTDANDASKNTRIPQTVHRQITVMPQAGGAIQSETMKLDFAVAKVRLTINNTSSGDQYVNDIKLSGINMESTPLFAEDHLSTENQGELSLGDMTIPAGESATVYAYFFENQNSNGYTLTAFWKKDQTLLLQTGFDDNKQNITEIPRGTELDINVKLNADVDINPTIYVQVNEWTGKTINVPAFE
ncbi:hypothetical protein [uncultured Bacteroides sp.]|uniref:hypothetical protein n=1 Tax=uncultured Bacteroides sp. TaxID=162156 RepID=UPI0026360461|nr:hypothetical protein [uncultured Bacteroides sp.]